ncbi:LysR family transcriptional regulator [Enterococcus faecalis]|uniref:LysR family transcriptional regulator n=1 Tax=Enterococcus faecalis TaxID=1351 RepID=UPI00045A2CD7|nr:LysR family transcriptional regulator [Enterococcus faecalis]KAJ84723.1 LysR family transcriptional regulator YeiE [Enterococcus faecalis NY9]
MEWGTIIQFLETFISVYETKNFTRTSEILYVSQPTVSSRISKLEEQLGVELFYRDGNTKIIPTKEADYLYLKSIQLLSEWINIKNYFKNKGNFPIDCKIGCSPTCAVYFVPKLIPLLIKKFSNVNFTIKMMSSSKVAEELYQNKINIGVIEKPIRHDKLDQHIIYKDTLVLAGRADSMYWLLSNEDSGHNFYNKMYLEQKKLTPKIICVNSHEVLISLLNNGVGQAIISELALTKTMARENIFELESRNFYMLFPKMTIRDELLEIKRYILYLSSKIKKSNNSINIESDVLFN